VSSTRTIDLGNASIFEYFPFENDSGYWNLPENDMEIMKQNFRNTNLQLKKLLDSVASSSIMIDTQDQAKKDP